jgi:hypothetical protein
MRIVVLAIQIAFAASSLWAQDELARLAGPQSVDSLRAGLSVTRSMGTDGSLSLLPPVSSRAAINAEMMGLHPSIGVEFLRVVKGAGATPNGAPATPNGALDWLRLYNTLHAASTMQGVTYWSVSRGKTEILFVQSYAISSAATRQRIPDPSSSTLPGDSLFYTFQEDHSFGKNTYEEAFSFPGDHIAVRIENLSTISLFLVPIVAPRSFVVRIVLAAAGRDLLFYGAAALRSSFPLGDRHSREESLVNRLAAMTEWLQREYALQPPS